MKELILDSEILKMSTLEIAELTRKQHKNVLRDVRSMIEQIDGSNLSTKQFQQVMLDNGMTKEILLDKELTFCLLAGYNARLRMKVIKRWMELEEQARNNAPKLPDFSNPAEAAREWARQYERAALESSQRQLAENQRDKAIKEKAWIGSRREATAMATASAATRKAAVMTKKAHRLMVALDESNEYATVRRMNSKYGKDFKWLPLKRMSSVMGLEIIKVPDPLYQETNSYHKDVWREVYGVGTEWEDN